MYCRECAAKTSKVDENLFQYKYKCSNTECGKTYSEKKEWVNNAGLLGSTLSVAGIIWKVANGEYLEAGIKIANTLTGNDDITNV